MNTISKPKRSLALDALRGIIMVIMATRHAEIFLTPIITPPEFWGGTIPNLNFGVPYWTRLIGHTCPTGFAFLMGVGMALFTSSRLRSNWSHKKIVKHFFIRGIILICLQFIAANVIWFFDNPSRLYPDHVQVIFYFGILYALGASMIINSFLLKLNWFFILFISLTWMVSAHLLMPAPELFYKEYPVIFRILLVAGQTGHTLVRFPVIPWVGVTGLGVVFGKIFVNNREKAYKISLFAGIISLILFFVVRLSGGFGNFKVYSGGDWRLFFYVSKLPPSIAYLTMTFGILFILLWILSKNEDFLAKHAKPLLVFGRVSLFFYLAHTSILALTGQIFFRQGAGLVMMYLACSAVLVVLYFLCKAYYEFKITKPKDSLYRFF